MSPTFPIAWTPTREAQRNGSIGYFFRTRPDRIGTVIADNLTRSGTLSALERICRVPRTDKGLAVLGQNKHFPFFGCSTTTDRELRMGCYGAGSRNSRVVMSIATPRSHVGAGYHWVPETIRKGHRVGRIAIEGGKGSVELRADGVIHLIWTPNIKIDVVYARAAMAMVNEVCNGVEHPMLVDMAAT